METKTIRRQARNPNAITRYHTRSMLSASKSTANPSKLNWNSTRSEQTEKKYLYPIEMARLRYVTPS